jgi:hypothetical protein
MLPFCGADFIKLLFGELEKKFFFGILGLLEVPLIFFDVDMLYMIL